MNLLNQLKNDLEELEKCVFAIMLFGSYAEGKPNIRSDIDACIVLGANDEDKIRNASRKILRISAKNEKYDIRIFEQIPLFMKMKVIEKGKILYAKNEAKLSEYFYFYRKLWKDQSVNRIPELLNN